MESIPLIDSPRQTATIVLGGQSVRLTVWWQPVSEAWYLSVVDFSGSPIALGRQVTARVRLVRSPAFAGDIVALPRRPGDHANIRRSAWQSTHTLAYFSAAEVAQVSWP